MSASRRKTSRFSVKKRNRSGLGQWVWLALFPGVLIGLALGTLLVWSRLPGPGGGQSKMVSVSGTESISLQMQREGLIRQPLLFEAYLRLTGSLELWQPGKHFLRADMTPKALADCLLRAPSRPKVQFTIPEGMDHYRVARRLETLGICLATDFLSLSHSQPLLSELGIKGDSVEGYLFPLTYSVPLDSDPESIIATCVGETRRHLSKVTEEHADAYHRLTAERGWGERELLTLASIIEKETPHDDERPVIAGVFFNRLDSPEFLPRQMLQSDPTALYGCLSTPESIPSCRGSSSSKPNPAMLRDSSNPYNTYRHPGLPPGPIANPGEASIAAVLAPAHSEYFFFVAKSGRHVFSRTLGEHNALIHDSQ